MVRKRKSGLCGGMPHVTYGGGAGKTFLFFCYIIFYSNSNISSIGVLGFLGVLRGLGLGACRGR